MQKVPGITINLAKGRGESFVDRFIVWALNIGRVVIILTEAVALSAFLYRFSLDRTLVDLHDRIAQEQAVVKLLRSNEDKFRNLQDRLSLAKQIIAQSNQTTTSFRDIISYIPPEIQITNISYAVDNIKIEGTTQSVQPISTLVNKLKNYPLISSVSVDKIDNRTATATLAITITATFKTNKAKLL